MVFDIIILDKDEELKNLLGEQKDITLQVWKDADSFERQIRAKQFDAALINPNCYKEDIAVLVKVLSYKKIPTIVILERYDDIEKTIDALSAGAFDYFSKPFLKIISREDKENIKKDVVQKITLSQNAKNKLRAIIEGEKETYDFEFSSDFKKIIIIGSSTGGPQSLDQIIPIIPKGIPTPIIIVQHMPEGFTQKFAERLNSISEISVKEAEDGEELKSGVCYVAKGDHHLVLKKEKNKTIITLNQQERMLGVRPCINITMESASKIYKSKTIGVILTGMGSDGTIGAKKIKEAGGTIIVQTPETAIISSMPKSVVEKKYCDEIVDLDKIPVALLQLL